MLKYATKFDKLPFNYSNFNFYELNNYCDDLNELEHIVEIISSNLNQMKAVIRGMQDTCLASVYNDALIAMKNNIANLNVSIKAEAKPRWLSVQDTDHEYDMATYAT